MNIDNDSNNGLADLIAELEAVYQENDFESSISRYLKPFRLFPFHLKY